MPPQNIKTIRQLIYWEYAKLISGSVVGDRKNYRFIMHTFKKLESKKLNPSSILKENTMLVMGENICSNCGNVEKLQWEHIISKSRGGPDTIDNQVLACSICNHSKCAKDPFEWYGQEKKYEVPRLALGKYLKLVFEHHEKAKTLDKADLNNDRKLDVFDLGAIFTKENT